MTTEIQESLDLTTGAVRLARALPIGHPSRASWLADARAHYTQHKNAIHRQKLGYPPRISGGR